MTVKNISLTEEAYAALQREKRESESFTEVVLRLTRREGKLSDCFGSWKLTDEEEAMVAGELSAGWKAALEGVAHEVP